jgi:hypothetical protein
MLGIRYFRKTAVDLWLGPPKNFVVDHRIELAGKTADQALQFLTTEFSKLSEHAKAHVGVEVPETISLSFADAALRCLKEACPSLTTMPRRVTFLLHSIDSYNEYQAKLFEYFNEDIES